MPQETHGGALAPFLIGLGLCGAVWASAGTSCAGPRSGPLTRAAQLDQPRSTNLHESAGAQDATDIASAPHQGPLPELDPEVASRLNLLQDAMSSSTVGLNQTHQPDQPGTQAIDWSLPPALPAALPTGTAEAAQVLTMGQQTEALDANPSTPQVATTAWVPPDDPAKRVQSLTTELAHAATELARSEGSAVQALMRLSALEIMLPGVSESAFGDGFVTAAVAPDELTLLQTWRDVMRSMGAADGGSSDAGSLVDAADRLTQATSAWRDLAIENPSLCTRVDGFGVYEPLPMRDGRYTFVAGRTNRVIVYLELDHFQTTTMRVDGRDGFAVELTQSLALYHEGTPRVEADRDLIAWQRPQVQIDDFSRRARRDFFIVQMVELPGTISVGSYRLKVRVTDRASSAEAETVIDVDFVADAALASSGKSR